VPSLVTTTEQKKKKKTCLARRFRMSSAIVTPKNWFKDFLLEESYSLALLAQQKCGRALLSKS
jgi:hypothetical protein